MLHGKNSLSSSANYCNKFIRMTGNPSAPQVAAAATRHLISSGIYEGRAAERKEFIRKGTAELARALINFSAICKKKLSSSRTMRTVYRISFC
ncbi:hypothetical protein CEXT_451151 [Caerostris extrusa]|uniref:Uncharacterized protein n=1 Tax=Caerostris extrusa TaxID=172846 RepID=A0AAV4Y2W5_CAEEX|nr:hypothetical protein CEXT_451151 [Caerostris extrusa]